MRPIVKGYQTCKHMIKRTAELKLNHEFKFVSQIHTHINIQTLCMHMIDNKTNYSIQQGSPLSPEMFNMTL